MKTPGPNLIAKWFDGPAVNTEVEALRILATNDELFTKIENETGVRFSPNQRRGIAIIFCELAEALDAPSTVSEEKAERLLARKSRDRLLKPMKALLREIREQEVQPHGDPRRNGVDQVIFPISEGSLEAAIRRLSRSNRGRPKQHKPREWVMFLLALEFASAGGRPAANYNPSRERPGGPFIKFLDLLLEACPDRLREHMAPGLHYAARQWLRQIGWTKVPRGREAAFFDLAMRRWLGGSEPPAVGSLGREEKCGD